jgi:hypothetical protein
MWAGVGGARGSLTLAGSSVTARVVVIQLVEECSSILEILGIETITDRGLTFVATAVARVGRFEEALATLEEAFLFVERTGQRYYQRSCMPER